MDNKKTKYECEKCNLNYNTKARLDAHINTELHKTGYRKKRSDYKDPYNCMDCDYKTKNIKMIKIHKLNKHSTKEERNNEYKYYCKLCDYGSFSIDSYNLHSNTIKHKYMELLSQKILNNN